MNIILSAAIQSRFAPLPKTLHILFCIVATVTFVILYLRQKKLKDLFWLIVCDMPLILQFYGDRITAFAVGVCELVLLFAIFLIYLSERKKINHEKSDVGEDDGGSGDTDDLKDVEDAVKAERTKLAGCDGDNNVINRAFDSDMP